MVTAKSAMYKLRPRKVEAPLRVAVPLVVVVTMVTRESAIRRLKLRKAEVVTMVTVKSAIRRLKLRKAEFMVGISQLGDPVAAAPKLWRKVGKRPLEYHLLDNLVAALDLALLRLLLVVTMVTVKSATHRLRPRKVGYSEGINLLGGPAAVVVKPPSKYLLANLGAALTVVTMVTVKSATCKLKPRKVPPPLELLVHPVARVPCQMEPPFPTV